MHNRPGIWVQKHKKGHAFLAPRYALYGRVFKTRDTDDMWRWEAHIDLSCLLDGYTRPLQGKAPTLEGAKAIVETLLIETGTVPTHKSYADRRKAICSECHSIGSLQVIRDRYYGTII